MRFFSLTNDPDHGLTKDYAPILRGLAERNIFVTTAVFCTIRDDSSDLAKHCYRGETQSLEDPEYRDLILEARDLGHEIAYHGYSQVSDTREEFLLGLELFKEVIGAYPKVYIEHGGHPDRHPLGMCKKENLAVEGRDTSSRYYIEDVVREKFDLVWTHDYLLDHHRRPLPRREVFVVKDGITYFQRSRMLHLPEITRHLNDRDNTVVGYTHFGYQGYRHRSLRRMLFDRGVVYERWIGADLPKTLEKLSGWLERNHLTALTVSDLYGHVRQDTDAMAD